MMTQHLPAAPQLLGNPSEGSTGASSADLTQTPHRSSLQHEAPPAEADTGANGAAASVSPLRKAASLPVSLPGVASHLSSLRGSATADNQQQPAAATATAAANLDGQTKQQLPAVSAAAEHAAQLATGRPSDVLHALACRGLPCSMPPADADAAAGTQEAAAQRSGPPASPSAISAGSQSCDICRQHGLDNEAAWHHFKVCEICPAGAGPDRLAWCDRYHILS
jgi:hypothetical protein